MTMREEFEAYCKREGITVGGDYSEEIFPIWQAAYIAGQKAMQERVAKMYDECDAACILALSIEGEE